LIKDLFKRLNQNKNENKKIKVKLSYLEIYNETIIDLLSDTKKTLLLAENESKGVYTPDLEEFAINSVEEILFFIMKGNEKRTMAST